MLKKNTYPLRESIYLSRSNADISPKPCQQKQNKIQISLHLQQFHINPTFAIQFIGSSWSSIVTKPVASLTWDKDVLLSTFFATEISHKI
jgi:hypothetical protein